MEKFFAAVRNMFSIPELRKRILFTLGLLAVYRLGAHVTTPGVNQDQLKRVWETIGSTLLGVLDLFSGGSFQTFIVARWLQANEVLPDGGWYVASTVLTLTTGTVFVMWLGEQITERGVGNGISLLIFAGIVIGLPSGVQQVAERLSGGDTMATLGVILMLAGMVLIIAFIVFVEAARRKIPVSYAKRHVGRQVVGGQQTTMTLKINMGGVIPVIFASSVLSMPQSVFAAFPPDQNNMNTWWAKVWSFFQVFHPSDPYYELIFLSLIIFFTFFYVSIVFNVEEVADSLRKHGGFMPGIRPGRATAEHLNTIMTRLTTVGAIYLALVAFVPQFMLSGFKVGRLPLIGAGLESWISTTPGLGWIPTGMGYQFYFGGTSLLILVGVAMDSVAQIEDQLVMRNYEGFLGSGRLRGRRG